MRTVSTFFLTSLVLVALASTHVLATEITEEQSKFFETKIRPVLIKECYGCHSNQSGNVRGGLRLDTQQLTHLGGSSGPAVVPGDLDESLLYNAITHEDFVMPPKRKLSQNVIDDFRQWIEMGAPDPRVNKIGEIKASITTEDIDQARETFWAYQPPSVSSTHKTAGDQWSDTTIDRFVLAKLEQSQLKPSRDAAPSKVLRRLCFDLVGLPPDPGQIRDFESRWKVDPKQAVEQLVEQLLDQPQFGERWGRHWLDVTRYAESTGREVNVTYPHAWRYRDFVIDSFNQDKPFNEFVQQQIAGDLLHASTDEKWAENLVATTFLAMGPKNLNEQNRVQFQADLVDEQIDATTRVFLGTSVACARCHDHKFDAIPQSDYYALAGIFGNANTFWGNPPSEFGTFSTAQMRRTSSLLLLPVKDPSPFDKRYNDRELAELRDEIEEKRSSLSGVRRNRQGEGEDARNAMRTRLRLLNELTRLSAKLAIVDENGNPRSYCMGVQDRDQTPQNAKLLVRGEIDQPAQEVRRGFPQVLCLADEEIDSDSSGRLEFAKWVGSERNPLTARVMVNRIWQNLIGQGIVTSTENFGITGQQPSHPELLDYLAVRFVESGWSVKTLIREITTSRIYRVSSEFNELAHNEDPENALLWRANPRRLDAEAIRDSMLSISGQIDLDRPRGSEVARAGFQRVRGGTLGDPRENMRQAISEAADKMRRQGTSADAPSGARGRFSARPGMGQGMGQGQRTGLGRGLGQRRPANGQASGSAVPQRSRRAMQRGGAPGRSMMTSDRSGDGRTPYQDVMTEAARKVSAQLDMEEARFRSVYLPIVRDEEPRSMVVFDFADSSTVTGARETSSTANQALFMMNNPFVLQQSQAFARRVASSEQRLGDQIRLAFVLAYGRPATSGERAATAKFLSGFLDRSQAAKQSGEALAAICQGLFASAEFRYID